MHYYVQKYKHHYDPSLCIFLLIVSNTGVNATLIQYTSNSAYPHQLDLLVMAYSTKLGLGFLDLCLKC